MLIYRHCNAYGSILLDMDDPMVRPEFSRLTAKEWITRYPLAVIDEIRKLPALVDSIKACYDANQNVRHVLLGSSHLMRLKGIRESLAGRAAIQESYPLTLPELMTDDWSDTATPSRLIRWLSDDPSRDPGNYLEGAVSEDAVRLFTGNIPLYSLPVAWLLS